MFEIFDTAGRVYTGPLEEALRVHKVRRTDAIHAINAFGHKLKQASATQAELQGELTANLPAGSPKINDAIQAYSEMLPEALERGPLLLAQQIMQTKVIRLKENDTVQAAWQLLRNHQIHQAPVLNVKGELVGILHQDDLLDVLHLQLAEVVASTKSLVSEVMTTPVIAAHGETDIRQIASVMLQQGSGGVPIISESGQLIGIISRSDIVRAVVHEPPLSLWT